MHDCRVSPNYFLPTWIFLIKLYFKKNKKERKKKLCPFTFQYFKSTQLPKKTFFHTCSILSLVLQQRTKGRGNYFSSFNYKRKAQKKEKSYTRMKVKSSLTANHCLRRVDQFSPIEVMKSCSVFAVQLADYQLGEYPPFFIWFIYFNL